MTDVRDDLTESEVLAWLQANPEFLEEKLDELTPAPADSSQDGPTSIAFYQVRALRETNGRLQQRLQELVRVAGENEALIGRLHELTLNLMAARSLEELVRAVADGMVKQFAAPHSRLFLSASLEVENDMLASPEHTKDILSQFADLAKRGVPLCGRIGAKKLAALFPEVEGPLSSAALIPLSGLGVLALGAPDDDKFQPGMETDFLELLGSMVTAAFSRHLEPGAAAVSRSAS